MNRSPFRGRPPPLSFLEFSLCVHFFAQRPFFLFFPAYSGPSSLPIGHRKPCFYVPSPFVHVPALSCFFPS